MTPDTRSAAERIADDCDTAALEARCAGYVKKCLRAAAAELRRLEERNAELEKLEGVVHQFIADLADDGPDENTSVRAEAIRRVLDGTDPLAALANTERTDADGWPR